MKPANARLAAFSGLAAVTTVASALALAALNTGGEAPAIRFAVGYDRKATPLVSGAAPMSPADRARAAALSRKAIAEFPYDTGAWLRLAYIDTLDHGGLSPEGIALLRRSYDLVAIDPEIGLWRVRFALENSQALPPDLRVAVRNETSGLWKKAANRRRLREIARSIDNPAGRLSLMLWLNRLQASAAK